jgi:putative MATE family efflux protein
LPGDEPARLTSFTGNIIVANSKALWKSFVVFLAPMMLSNVLQSLFGTINNVYLGQMIGVEALAAVSVLFPVVFFCIAFVMGLSSGATVLIGQAWGAGERDKVKAVAGATLAIAMLLASIAALAGGLFSRQLMIALATPPDILDQAVSYARIMLLTMPLTFVFLLMTAMLRGVGDTFTPLLALTVSTAVGLTVTPVLIRGWFGLPALGVASAAWASAIATLLTLLWLAAYLRRSQHPLAPDAAFLRRVRLDGALLRTVLRIGIPSAVSMVVMSIAELVLLGLVNSFGSNATAAYGACNQVMSYVQFTAMSIAVTVSIFGAQAIGAGNAGRLDAIVRTGLLLNLILTGGLVALIYLFSRIILGFFITDAAVLDLAQRLLHIVLWSSVLFGMATVVSGMMRASGTVFAPMALSILAIAAVEVPSAVILSRSIGVEGIWAAYPITFTAMFILQMSYYMLVWRRRTVQRLI